MKVMRKSILTGLEREKDLNITQEQLDSWMSGEKFAQDAFPQLSPEDREFIMTGISDEEWTDLMLDKEGDTEDT